MLAVCMRGEGAGETNVDTGGFVQFVRFSCLRYHPSQDRYPMDTLHPHVLPTGKDFEAELERKGEPEGRETGRETHTERREGADGIPTRDLQTCAR